MKENTLDVLFYLFDNFSDYDDSGQTRSVLQSHLEGAGYALNDISRAFDWLESLASEKEEEIKPAKENSIRIFSHREKKWLNQECQNYLHYLYNASVLTHELREVVIDRVLALRDMYFSLDRLKWVVLMVLLNRPEAEAEYVWMDDVALNDTPPVYH